MDIKSIIEGLKKLKTKLSIIFPMTDEYLDAAISALEEREVDPIIKHYGDMMVCIDCGLTKKSCRCSPEKEKCKNCNGSCGHPHLDSITDGNKNGSGFEDLCNGCGENLGEEILKNKGTGKRYHPGCFAFPTLPKIEELEIKDSLPDNVVAQFLKLNEAVRRLNQLSKERR